MSPSRYVKIKKANNDSTLLTLYITFNTSASLLNNSRF
jgi:hypothetical protein